MINDQYFSNTNTQFDKIFYPCSSSSFYRQGCQWRRPYLRSAAPAELFTIGSIVKCDRSAAIKLLSIVATKRNQNEWAKRRRVSCDSTRLNIKSVLSRLNNFKYFSIKIVYLKVKMSKKIFFINLLYMYFFSHIHIYRFAIFIKIWWWPCGLNLLKKRYIWKIFALFLKYIPAVAISFLLHFSLHPFFSSII